MNKFPKMKRRNTARWLVVIGVFCILVPAVYEVASVPWSSLGDGRVNEAVMREPKPLEIDYVDYTDGVDYAAEQPADLPSGYLLDETRADKQAASAAYETEAYLNSNLSDEAEDSKYTRLGTVKIPRLDVSENLLEGADGDVFDYGIGHAEWTALPGEEGNSVIAAHRVSNAGMEPFRYLNRLKTEDIIEVSFNGDVFEYEVFDSFTVSKYDVWVMSAVEDESHVLTLITCDPVIYAGNRPNRLIVRARLITSESAGAE